mmetsp:Transcript_32643/g.23592  ORF Transcript_32643/g.23592 Transcript_32643/m.23592 type:complete len:105 (+) Transcript_32643:415-729(+)
MYAFCSTCTTIVSGSLAERTFIDTYIFYSFLMTAIVFPIPASWVWGDGFLQRMGFIDFAGCSVVHMLGGVSGLIGTYILGPRLGVFDQKNNNPSALADLNSGGQ